jgi:2,3-bisphosphoglycerate-independent phosphoglycerate mutase
MLMILDGWGINPSADGNAVKMANTPYLDHLAHEYPGTRLTCCGEAVGLPKGIMGNSEVGHLNIGAGRIVYQVLLRIDRAIADGSFFENSAFGGIMQEVQSRGSALHLMGLVSDAGVHSQMAHLFALIEMAFREKLPRVYVHAILDGRDTSPKSGAEYIQRLKDFVDSKKTGNIADICGRYYAMDRDTRWERTEKAYRLYTLGEGLRETHPVAAVEKAYQRGETDEFVCPVVMTGKNGTPVGTVSDGDGIIFFNFRPDRARQIVRAFTEPRFNLFKREKSPTLCDFACMTAYDETFTLPVAFPPVRLENILGEVISAQGLNQLRIAETEKYAHVTYFFNGGEETAFPNEDRCLVPSPRNIATYDEKPEMSAYAVAEKTVGFLRSGKHHMLVVNFANLDMVGHTGDLKAAVKACEAVDRCVEKVVTAVRDKQGVVLVTADHGNAEMMIDANGQPHTAHTLNPVPFILVSKAHKKIGLRPGVLGDIAPTLLDIMGIPQPGQMTGQSLIQR